MPLPAPAQQRAIVQQAAGRHGIDPAILWGLFGAESNFGRNAATSSAGAVGPFQFEPSTARSLGVNPYDFASAADGAARYLGQYRGRGVAGMLAAYNAGPQGNPNNPETRAYVPRVLQLSKQWGGAAGPSAPSTPVAARVTSSGPSSGGIDAQRGFALAEFLRRKSPFDIGAKTALDPNAPLLSILPATQPQDTLSQAHASVARLAGGVIRKVPSASARGVAQFDGKPVAGWIAPALQWARERGWTGSVTSGFRSFAAQERIYDSGVRPAAKPGTSNHEGTDFPRGAVDVSQAAQLAALLKRSPYAGRLVWAGAKDPPHFSFPHDGSY